MKSSMLLFSQLKIVTITKKNNQYHLAKTKVKSKAKIKVKLKTKLKIKIIWEIVNMTNTTNMNRKQNEIIQNITRYRTYVKSK